MRIKILFKSGTSEVYDLSPEKNSEDNWDIDLLNRFTMNNRVEFVYVYGTDSVHIIRKSDVAAVSLVCK